MKRLLRGLGPNVIALGLASFFTDFASEMIFPLMPMLVIGALKGSEATLGLMEGLAGSLSSLLRIVSGWLSDRFRRRKPFIFAGYAISSLARPFFGLAAAAWHVIAIRLVVGFGKGFRLAARDALIVDSCEPSVRGKAFGFQHAMDQLGSALGPLVAFALLWRGMDLRSVFLVTAIPAAMVLVVIGGLVRDIPSAHPGSGSLKLTLKPFDRRFKAFLVVVTLFTLGNSSDIFLLRRAEQLGVEGRFIPLVWVGLSVVRMAVAVPGGMLADALGKRRLILFAWGVYTAVYGGLAFADSLAPFLVLVAVYGVYAALGESVLRATVADLVPERLLGTAYGMFHFCVGLAALPASWGFGEIYRRWGATPAFLVGAGFAALAAILLLGVNLKRPTPAASPSP